MYFPEKCYILALPLHSKKASLLWQKPIKWTKRFLVSEEHSGGKGKFCGWALGRGGQGSQENLRKSREADMAAWALPEATAGDLNGPTEHERPGPLRTGWANRMWHISQGVAWQLVWKGTQEGPRSLSTAQGSAQGLCQNSGYLPQS